MVVARLPLASTALIRIGKASRVAASLTDLGLPFEISYVQGKMTDSSGARRNYEKRRKRKMRSSALAD
jgi:hypothetical protein